MRVLVAGRNAEMLAKVAGTFANDLQIFTATTKADCFALLANFDFDLIIACETLADGPGLEVLSQVVVNTPNTLRIFAARPATLDLLKDELGFFGLFRTLPYPINFRKLWAAISLAQGACGEPASGVMPALGLLSAARATAAQGSAAHRSTPPAVRYPASATAPTPGIRHVVLEDTWEVEAPFAVAPQEEPAAPQQPQPAPQEQPLRQQQPPALQQQPFTLQQHRPAPEQQSPVHLDDVTSGMRAAARYAAAHSASVAATAPARIPESESFKRARARRNAANRDAANGNATSRDTANRNTGKREPVISNHSLAELAKRFATPRPLAQWVRAPIGIKRAVLLVGSGFLVAITLAVLTIFMVNANKSTEPANLPMIASVNQPLPHKVFPWQPETQQPTQQVTPTVSEATPAVAAGYLEPKAEAGWEAPDDDPDHPVRPPDAPPQLSEPQNPESPGQRVNE